MGINIGDNFDLRSEKFMDNRQCLAVDLNSLKNWDVPVPDGFEVYVDQKWYTYDSNNELDATLGKFKERKGADDSPDSSCYLDGGEVDSIYGGVGDYDCGEI